MIFMCLQLLYYFGVSCKARLMALAQGDTSLAMVLLSVQREAIIFPCLSAFLLFIGYLGTPHCVPRIHSYHGKRQKWWIVLNTVTGDINPRGTDKDRSSGSGFRLWTLVRQSPLKYFINNLLPRISLSSLSFSCLI